MKPMQQYQKVSSYEAVKGTFDTCLLLYSGGLDTSVMLKWIQENYGCKVVTLTVDVGQATDDLEAIKQKALALGASKAIVYDAKQAFADELLSMAIKANADYQGGYALGTCLSRVIVSQVAVKVAKENECKVVAHGCTGKGNDQVRFDAYITTLDPGLKIIAPVREWGMGREEEILYAQANGIPIAQSIEKSYSYDENMWGNACEGGALEQVEAVVDLTDALKWCTPPKKAPDVAQLVKISFEKGVPTAIDGQALPLDQLIASANKIGARHGVGIVEFVEDRLIGFKVREVYEHPGASLLIEAHKKLEQLVSTRMENELKPLLDQKWAYATYSALWFEPTMHHIHAYINDQNEKVTGEVTLELYKGVVTVKAMTSPYSLFDHDLMTSFEKSALFNQNASSGFIELYSLQQQTAHKVYTYK
jgi:argininosuccinate synthase